MGEPETLLSADTQQNALAVPDQARALEVIDPRSYERAAEMLDMVRSMRREISQAFDPIVAAAHSAHETACEQRRKYDEPVAKAEALLRQKLAGYVEMVGATMMQMERELSAQAVSEATIRVEAEAKALEAAGDLESAIALRNEPLDVPPVIVPNLVPDVAGIGKRTMYYAEVTDVLALARAVVEGRVPIGAIQADEKFLNGKAREMRDDLKWPGVVVRRRVGIVVK